MNFWVEKLLLLGIDKEYGNSTILQIMIRINTINLAGDDILKHVDVSLPPSSIVLADAGGIYHFRFRYKTYTGIILCITVTFPGNVCPEVVRQQPEEIPGGGQEVEEILFVL